MKLTDFTALHPAKRAELRSVEERMADHLARLARQTHDATLAEEIDAHREQTLTRRDWLDDLPEDHGTRPDARLGAVAGRIVTPEGA